MGSLWGHGVAKLGPLNVKLLAGFFILCMCVCGRGGKGRGEGETEMGLFFVIMYNILNFTNKAINDISTMFELTKSKSMRFP